MKIYCLFFLFSLPLLLLGQSDADAIIGEYWTEKQQGKIAIYKSNDRYYGKILWRADPQKDQHNPDPTLRDSSVIGLVFLKDFVFKNGKWVKGKVYSIDNGKTYSGKLWLEDAGKVLKMRGFLGFSLLGRTAQLTRVENSK
ncbi:MAG: DUF2147 domain-containing protein [Bacteroidota bacterium]